MKPLKVVVLASGSGTLFQALIDAAPNMNIDIVGLITDVECPAIERANKAGITTHIVALQDDRAAWDEALRQAIHVAQPDLVVSAGFMKILGPRVLGDFEGRIINTHPALLPNFPGAHAVRDALAAHATETGTTIHFVDAGVDTGKVIAQRVVEIHDTDDEASLHERIKIQERELLVETVGNFATGSIRFPDVTKHQEGSLS